MADEHDDATDPSHETPIDSGAGQGGGTGGLTGNEGSLEPPDPAPTREDDTDGWDARTADAEQLPADDLRDPDLPGDPIESDPPVDDEVIPGAPPQGTDEAVEGGSGRP